MEKMSDVVSIDHVCDEVEMSKISSCVNMSEYASHCEDIQNEVTEIPPLIGVDTSFT